MRVAKKKMRGVPQLGERIKRFMEAANLDASELSARTGISTSYLSRILNGEVANPTIDFVKRIADGLGVTETELVRDEDMQEIGPIPVEDGQAEEREEQGRRTRMPTTLNRALELPDSLFDALGGEIEEIRGLIASTHFTAEEEEMVKSALDIAKRLIKFIAAQRNMRKDG
jgi:transcriptional regulator with XRE-family HTH domain